MHVELPGTFTVYISDLLETTYDHLSFALVLHEYDFNGYFNSSYVILTI